MYLYLEVKFIVPFNLILDFQSTIGGHHRGVLDTTLCDKICQ